MGQEEDYVCVSLMCTYVWIPKQIPSFRKQNLCIISWDGICKSGFLTSAHSKLPVRRWGRGAIHCEIYPAQTTNSHRTERCIPVIFLSDNAEPSTARTRLEFTTHSGPVTRPLIPTSLREQRADNLYTNTFRLVQKNCLKCFRVLQYFTQQLGRAGILSWTTATSHNALNSPFSLRQNPDSQTIFLGRLIH